MGLFWLTPDRRFAVVSFERSTATDARLPFPAGRIESAVSANSRRRAGGPGPPARRSNTIGIVDGISPFGWLFGARLQLSPDIRKQTIGRVL